MYCPRHCESSPGLRNRRRLEGVGGEIPLPPGTRSLPFEMLASWLLYYLSIHLSLPAPSSAIIYQVLVFLYPSSHQCPPPHLAFQPWPEHLRDDCSLTRFCISTCILVLLRIIINSSQKLDTGSPQTGLVGTGHSHRAGCHADLPFLPQTCSHLSCLLQRC